MEVKRQNRKILVLCEVGGTLGHKYQEHAPEPGKIKAKYESFTHKKRVSYLRPGAREFINTLKDSKNIIFAFHSSMKQENIKKTLENIFPDIESSMWIIFDADYCTEFNKNPYLRGIKTEWYEKYRDLSLVVNSRLCMEYGIGTEDCILIESENKKIQGYLNNSLLSSALVESDLLMEKHPEFGIVRDE